MEPKEKEVDHFAEELYTYLWSKQNFKTLSIENLLTTGLRISECELGRKTHFTEAIGRAVLCSQYLLRDLCRYFFLRIDKATWKSTDDFNMSLSVLIAYWTCNRANIFQEFIDTCAIVAEAIIYMDAMEKMVFIPSEAQSLFAYFFHCELAQEFYGKGGWAELHKEACEKYAFIYSFITPLMSKIEHPYGSLEYDCNLIKNLTDSPIFFPVAKSKVCRYCYEQLENQCLYCFDIGEKFADFYELGPYEATSYQPAVADEQAIGLQSIDKKIEGLSQSYQCLFVGKISEMAEVEISNLRLERRKNLKKERKI